MKKLRSFIIVLMLGVLIFALTAGMYFETRHLGWISLRTAIVSDDTALDGTTDSYTYSFGDKPAAAIPVDPGINGGDVCFYGTDAANEICNYKLYVYKETGPALLWCSGVVTLGAAVVKGETSTYYADTITVVQVHGDSAKAIDVAGDRVCVLRLKDLRGARWIFLEIDIPASTQVASITGLFTGY